MNEDPRDLPAMWLAIFMAMVAVGLLAYNSCRDTAEAQDAPHRTLSARDTHDLAACLVAERSGHADDDAAILSVLARRSVRFRGSIGETARHYCSALRTRHPSRRQAEILALPGGPAARRYAAAWASAISSVRAFLAGTLRHACNAEPDEWGDRLTDARRARRAGWVLLNCGRLANLVWSHGTVSARVARGGGR